MRSLISDGRQSKRVYKEFTSILFKLGSFLSNWVQQVETDPSQYNSCGYQITSLNFIPLLCKLSNSEGCVLLACAFPYINSYNFIVMRKNFSRIVCLKFSYSPSESSYVLMWSNAAMWNSVWNLEYAQQKGMICWRMFMVISTYLVQKFSSAKQTKPSQSVNCCRNLARSGSQPSHSLLAIPAFDRFLALVTDT